MPKHLALALLAVSAFASAQTISSKTAGMKHIDGYLPLDWDAKAGKLYLEITHLDTDILYLTRPTHPLPAHWPQSPDDRAEPALPLDQQ